MDAGVANVQVITGQLSDWCLNVQPVSSHPLQDPNTEAPTHCIAGNEVRICHTCGGGIVAHYSRIVCEDLNHMHRNMYTYRPAHMHGDEKLK